MAQNSSTSIGFRLNGEHLTALAERADLASVSVHECARNLVITGLTAKPGTEREEIARLRNDLAVLLEAILIVGRILTPAEAEELVREKLQLK